MKSTTLGANSILNIFVLQFRANAAIKSNFKYNALGFIVRS